MKKNLQSSDVVLVHIREKPAFYAQIKCIEPDIKKGWYRVALRSFFGELQWILEDIHVFLGQAWTFRGIPYRLQKIGGRREKSGGSAKVIRLKRLK